MADIKVKMLKTIKVEHKKKYYELEEGSEHGIGEHELEKFVKAGYCEVPHGKKVPFKASKKVEEDKAVKSSGGK